MEDKAWGAGERVLAFQSLGFQIEGLNAPQVDTLSHRFNGFVSAVNATPGLAQCRCLQGEMGDIEVPLANEHQEYQPAVDYRGDGLSVQGYNFSAKINLDGTQQRTCLYTEIPEHVMRRDVIDNYLRVAAAYAALTRGGLLMHSSGIVIDGRAYLLIGRSGAGKTTCARMALAAGARVLSDDINILLPVNQQGFQAGPVPLTGELALAPGEEQTPYKVGGIFWLEQANCTEITSISLATRASRLMVCCPVVNVDSYRQELLLAIIDNLLSIVPMHVLRFRRDEKFSRIESLIGNMFI